MATATKSRQTRRSSKAKTNLLDRLPSYEERVQMRYLSVLRNKVGSELSRKAKFEHGAPFNWDEFKSQFNADYDELTTPQLAAHLRYYYNLNTAEEVDAAFDQQQKLRQQRQDRRGY